MSASDLWAAASIDTEQELRLRLVTTARVGVQSVWSFLASAEDEADFDNRQAMVAERIDAAVADATAVDPERFVGVRDEVLASLREEYKILAAKRKVESFAAAEPDTRARVVAELARQAEEAVQPSVTGRADPFVSEADRLGAEAVSDSPFTHGDQYRLGENDNINCKHCKQPVFEDNHPTKGRMWVHTYNTGYECEHPEPGTVHRASFGGQHDKANETTCCAHGVAMHNAKTGECNACSCQQLRRAHGSVHEAKARCSYKNWGQRCVLAAGHEGDHCRGFYNTPYQGTNKECACGHPERHVASLHTASPTGPPWGVGDRVRIDGGFEDGLTGTIVGNEPLTDAEHRQRTKNLGIDNPESIIGGTGDRPYRFRVKIDGGEHTIGGLGPHRLSPITSATHIADRAPEGEYEKVKKFVDQNWDGQYTTNYVGQQPDGSRLWRTNLHGPDGPIVHTKVHSDGTMADHTQRSAELHTHSYGDTDEVDPWATTLTTNYHDPDDARVPVTVHQGVGEYDELGRHMHNQINDMREKGITNKGQPATLPCQHCGADADFDKLYASFPSSYANYVCPNCNKETHYKPGYKGEEPPTDPNQGQMFGSLADAPRVVIGASEIPKLKSEPYKNSGGLKTFLSQAENHMKREGHEPGGWEHKVTDNTDMVPGKRSYYGINRCKRCGGASEVTGGDGGGWTYTTPGKKCTTKQSSLLGAEAAQEDDPYHNPNVHVRPAHPRQFGNSVHSGGANRYKANKAWAIYDHGQHTDHYVASTDIGKTIVDSTGRMKTSWHAGVGPGDLARMHINLHGPLNKQSAREAASVESEEREYADQHAHDVAWMTADERALYDERTRSVDDAVHSQAVLGHESDAPHGAHDDSGKHGDGSPGGAPAGGAPGGAPGQAPPDQAQQQAPGEGELQQGQQVTVHYVMPDGTKGDCPATVQTSDGQTATLTYENGTFTATQQNGTWTDSKGATFTFDEGGADKPDPAKQEGPPKDSGGGDDSDPEKKKDAKESSLQTVAAERVPWSEVKHGDEVRFDHPGATWFSVHNPSRNGRYVDFKWGEDHEHGSRPWGEMVHRRTRKQASLQTEAAMECYHCGRPIKRDKDTGQIGSTFTHVDDEQQWGPEDEREHPGTYPTPGIGHYATPKSHMGSLHTASYLDMLDPSEAYFDAAQALYWYAANYHGGQASDLYRMMGELDYHPGMSESGPEEDGPAADIYAELEAGTLDPQDVKAWVDRGYNAAHEGSLHTADKPRGDMDRSVAFTILLDLLPGYGDSADDGGSTVTQFLNDWYADPSTDMYEFGKRWVGSHQAALAAGGNPYLPGQNPYAVGTPPPAPSSSGETIPTTDQTGNQSAPQLSQPVTTHPRAVPRGSQPAGAPENMNPGNGGMGTNTGGM